MHLLNGTMPGEREARLLLAAKQKLRGASSKQIA